jgi:hypothetical protein
VKDESAGLHNYQLPGVDTANKQQCISWMERRWGRELAQKIISNAQAQYKKLSPQTQRWLDTNHGDNRLLSNHPAILFGLHMLHQGVGRLSKQKAEEWIKAIQTDANYEPGNKLNVDTVRLLRYVASAGDAKELPAKSKEQKHGDFLREVKSKMPKGQIESRIKELRTHPAYFDKSHKSHKEVVQQVSDLYSKIHGGA